MKKRKTYNRAKTKIRYHIIFSTKYRRKCLEGIRDSIMTSFDVAQNISKFTIHAKEIDKDHIHLLIEIPPSFSISSAVKRLKQITTKYIWDNQEEHMKKYYWGDKKRLWTNGYFCSTIGDISEDIITNYIKNQ